MKQKKILVIQPLPGMGDIFWFDDVLQSLSQHYKQTVSLLTKKQSQAHAIYRNSSYVDQVLWIERPGAHAGLLGLWRLAQLLKKHQFTHVWILHKSWRYHFIARLAKIPHIFKMPPSCYAVHPTKRASIMLPHYGVTYRHGLPFPVDAAILASVRHYVPLESQKSALFAIGGTEVAKKWPLENWVALGDVLLRQGFFITVLGGPKETEEAQAIKKRLHHKDIQICTSLTIPQALAVIQGHDVVIGNDTGMMNGAVVLNKKVCALFLGSPPLSYRKGLTPITGTTKGAISVDQVQKALDGDFIRCR